MIYLIFLIYTAPFTIVICRCSTLHFGLAGFPGGPLLPALWRAGKAFTMPVPTLISQPHSLVKSARDSAQTVGVRILVKWT